MRIVSDPLLGELGLKNFRVATKANPWYKDGVTCDFYTSTDGLQPKKVKEQLRRSLDALRCVRTARDLL